MMSIAAYTVGMRQAGKRRTVVAGILNACDLRDFKVQ
jgi:hypothetical protein